jgi:hypothetical protein
MTFLIQLLQVSQLVCFLQPHYNLAVMLVLPYFVLPFSGDRSNFPRQA